MKEENESYRVEILVISLMIDVAVFWLLARFRLIGVEEAYAFVHCPSDFFPVLIYRTCLYGAGFTILAAVPIINFLVPNFRHKRGK